MGEKKSFQEVLDEHLKSQRPAAPSTEKPAPPNYTFEFDFSFLGLPKPSKIKAAAYPAAALKKPAVPPPRRKDQFVEVAKLSSIEVAALKALDLKLEGASSALSRAELKTKYRTLVRKLHPDRHTAALTSMERKVLTEKFHQVLEAYDLLNQAFSRLIPTQQ